MTALLAAGFVLLILAILFWPESGQFWRWRRGLRNTERILIEDALKHLYDREYKELICTLESISGVLSISGDQAAELMVRLGGLGLVRSESNGFKLTSEGRSYALRMIRIHRLWERYLADETGVAETEWHSHAEKLEHTVTDQEAEELAATVGHPSYDPHGDPIPTRSGILPPKRGMSLIDLEEGKIAQIIHIEDEPRAIYAQLCAEGLHPGMRVQMLGKDSERVSFIADGEEIVLAPIVAGNITVLQISTEVKMEGPFESLASLKIGEKAEVVGISKACRGPQRRRLMDLGIIPGTTVSAEMRSAGGDPTAYNIREASIALRKQHAELIHIKRLQEEVS